MMLPGLYDIRTELERLVAIVGAPADLLPTYNYSRDSAYPHDWPTRQSAHLDDILERAPLVNGAWGGSGHG